MIQKVYLMWNSYTNNELIPIGCLTRLDTEKYAFQYFEKAKEAMALGCFLPFPYMEEVYIFDGLPHFFEQRIIKGEFNSAKFGVKHTGDNKLGFLVYGDSIKNSDNFKVITEEKFKSKVF